MTVFVVLILEQSDIRTMDTDASKGRKERHQRVSASGVEPPPTGHDPVLFPPLPAPNVLNGDIPDDYSSTDLPGRRESREFDLMQVQVLYR